MRVGPDPCDPVSSPWSPHSGRMENKAMYLHSVSERDTNSLLDEPFDGRCLSKLNLCDDGKWGRAWLPQFCSVLSTPVSSADKWVGTELGLGFRGRVEYHPYPYHA